MTFALHTCLVVAMLAWGPSALAQTTLGALLDAGAKPRSPAEFTDEVAQRMIVGPTPTGGKLELMYARGGTIQGTGTQNNPASNVTPWLPVRGEWSVDDRNRICTSLAVSGGGLSGATAVLVLPTRCQYWFKLGKDYFFADSDTDRSAKVLVRTIKQ